MNTEKISKVVDTTDGHCLEDVLLALGFEPERRWAATCYIKDDTCIVIPPTNPFSEFGHPGEVEPYAFLEMISHNFQTTLLVVVENENTGGSWVVDPVTHKRVSRNSNDLQKAGVTYDDVYSPHPNDLWKYSY